MIALESWTEVLGQGFSKKEKEQILILLERMAYNAAEFTREEREFHDK